MTADIAVQLAETVLPTVALAVLGDLAAGAISAVICCLTEGRRSRR